MAQVFRIRTVGGDGWVRELYDGAPIITGCIGEAETWATRTEAGQVAKDAARTGHLTLRVEAGPVVDRFQFVP